MPRPNVIQGINGDHKVKDISIQNLFTDGVCVGSAVAGNFSIDATSTNAIRLMRSADNSCHTP